MGDGDVLMDLLFPVTRGLMNLRLPMLISICGVIIDAPWTCKNGGCGEQMMKL